MIIENGCDLIALLSRQIGNFFGITSAEVALLKEVLPEVLQRTERCFNAATSKYFFDEAGNVRFNPFNSVQYMVFLYYFGNSLSKCGRCVSLCDRIYYLNKVLNACDIFYAIELPDFWGAEHPVGSVLGRATYGDGFFFYQGCTVGGNYDKFGVLHYPIIGRNVRMYANASIIGKCNIGDNVVLGAEAMVKNEDVPSGTIVFGQSPKLIIKELK